MSYRIMPARSNAAINAFAERVLPVKKFPVVQQQNAEQSVNKSA